MSQASGSWRNGSKLETLTPTSRSAPGRSPRARSSRLVGAVDAGGQRDRAGADREVRVAHLGGDGAGGIATGGEAHGDTRGHATELGVEHGAVGDVALEGLLVADRDALHRRLQRAWVDAAGAVAQHRADLAANQPAQGVVVECRQRADGGDA